jgi:2-haloacid dehalogenase
MGQSIHLFDAYGTLLDVHSAVARYRDAVGPDADRLSEIWRAKHLEYTWVHSLAGRPASFRTLLVRSLDFAAARLNVTLSADLRTNLLTAYDSLTPFAEVKDTLVALKRRNNRVAILSNGDPDLLDKAVRAAGLHEILDAVLSASDVGVFKPSGRVYRLGLTKFGADRSDITFVSSNRWDVAGAQFFGFKTVWVNRSGMPDEYPDMPAGAIVSTLDQLPALTS